MTPARRPGRHRTARRRTHDDSDIVPGTTGRPARRDRSGRHLRRDWLSISSRTRTRGVAYAGVRNGSIPATRIGRRWLIPRRRFHPWLDGTDAAEIRDRGRVVA